MFFFILKLAGICQPIDKVIKKKIQCLMDEGVTKVAEMKRHIKSFSKKDLGKTSTQNRRFYPLDKDIRNVMDSYKKSNKVRSCIFRIVYNSPNLYKKSI